MRIKAVADRLEGDKVVLLLGDEELQIVWPCALFPDDVREGDIFDIAVTFDLQATQEARAAGEALLKALLAENQDE
ncbi:DUF3006 domain-containing protein [Propionispora hippei]|uniref:DUF3006 domain-containing protein n=1 Tax=Propionispora hippei DSM 15287 TaxID=1123003 RepID=A0A1M6C392_9FIRM|nr:DUF3006 domain-containing protein [Propionispora hippei]SHI55422.1 Protein of unknown function [Propionispora hippei DSM 15287]